MTALRGRYHDEKIWEKTTADVGGDFYDHLRDLVAGRREELATTSAPWISPSWPRSTASKRPGRFQREPGRGTRRGEIGMLAVISKCAKVDCSEHSSQSQSR